MREYVATHPRKTALALAALAGFIFFLGCIVLLSLDQFKDIQRGTDAIAKRALAIRTEVNAVLVQLNANVQPDCHDKTLGLMRAELVHTRFIADLGILNENGHVACNTTVGKLETPVSLGAPDFQGKTAEGWVVSSYLARPLPGVHSNQETLITVNGRFYSAPPADVLIDLFDEVPGALQLNADATRGVHTAIESHLLTEQWRELLKTPAYIGESNQFYDWSNSAFVQIFRLPGTYYVVQQVVPVSVSLLRYSGSLAWSLVFALIIAALVFFALRPIFLSWRALEYRIPFLLARQNLLCMYQPIIDLATGKTSGCEVLMRLRDGDTIIPPDVAIPAIMKRNLTWELDQLVVDVAVAELRGALPDLIDFKVAFNFFPSSVSSGKIREMVEAVLERSPHKGLRFDVEILEQEYKDSMIQAVADLRSHNFLVSVDDFGTGFSNLGSIKALLPDFLKIDRSFVRDMESATIRSSLIPEIIAIGRAVGAKLIAEGIESERQYRMLKDMGVEYGQGYLMCNPLPIDAFAAYIHDREAQS